MPHEAPRLYHFIKEQLVSEEEWIVTHSLDSDYKRNVNVYSDLLETDRSLDFDEVDETKFYQEDSDKTAFKNGKLSLKGLGIGNIYAHYHLNEGTGETVLDSSGNGRHGTPINNPVSVEGKLNNCLSFNGSNQYVNLGNIANFERTDAFSVEFFLKSTNIGTKSFVSKSLSSGKGWQVYSVSNKLSFYLINNVSTNAIIVQTDFNIIDGNYRHVIITYDGSSNAGGVHIYVDSDSKIVSILSNNLTASIQTIENCQINGRYGVDSLIAGLIDEVVIYDKELTQEEVTDRWNNGEGTEISGYDTSKGWYTRTNNNQIDTSAWLAINRVEFTQETPTDTQLRYLISVDNKVTWKKWNDSSWVTYSINDIHTDGNTREELENLVEIQWNLLFIPGNLDIVVGLKTTNEAVTPELNQVNIIYILIGKIKVKDSNINIVILNETQLKIKNISENTLYNLRVLVIL